MSKLLNTSLTQKDQWPPDAIGRHCKNPWEFFFFLTITVLIADDHKNGRHMSRNLVWARG